MRKQYAILSLIGISLILMLLILKTTSAISVSGNSSIYSFNVSCNVNPTTTSCSADTLTYTCQIDDPAFINFVEFKINGNWYNTTQNINQFSLDVNKGQQNSSINTTITLQQERIHDNNNGYINAFENATVQNDCSICTPNYQIIQACNSTNEQIVNITYAPTACNNDTIQIQACTYCTPTWQARTGGIYDCQPNGFKLQYYDDFGTCCTISPLNCIYPADQNTNTTCGYFSTDMTCQYDAQPYLNSKINFACTIPSQYAGEIVNCITYVRKQNQTLLIQSNPEYADPTTFQFWKESETRQSFTNTGLLINAYYTDKAIETGQDFILGMKCTTPDGTILTSEYNINPTYQPPTFFLNWTVWAGDNIGYIIIWLIGFIIIVLGISWTLKKARGRK